MEVYKGTADYIALCFAQENREAAEKLAEWMNRERLRVWSSDRGCNPKKKADAARLAGCRTAVILISENWLADDRYTSQLQGAAQLNKQMVLLFLDETDLSGNEALNLLLSRSVRMTDYKPDAPDECYEELLSLECIQDCKMKDDEQPDTEKTGLLGFLSRDISDL